MPHDLATLHTRLACLRAECAILKLRQQAQTLLAHTTDPERRVRLAEVVRIGRCPPDRVIRGAHGYFVGCMDGGGAFHTTDVLKMGGMKHEVEARYQRSRDDAKAKAAEDKATKGAAKLTAEQRQQLETLQVRLRDENARIAEQIAKLPNGSRQWKALTKELGTRVTEYQILKAHLARADAAAKSAPAKASGGKKTDENVSKGSWGMGAKPLYRPPAGYIPNPYGPLNVQFMHRVYGSDQLAAALGDHTTERLKVAASLWVRDHPEDGKPANLTKAGLIEFLTHVAIARDGRIASQADADKAEQHTPLPSIQPLKPSEMLASKSAGKQSASDGTPRPPRAKVSDTLSAKPRWAVPGYHPNPYARINLLATHRMYGSAQLATALKARSVDELRSLADDWMKTHPDDGKPASRSSRDALVTWLTKVAIAHDGRIDTAEESLAAQKNDPIFSAGPTGVKQYSTNLDEIEQLKREWNKP